MYKLKYFYPLMITIRCKYEVLQLFLSTDISFSSISCVNIKISIIYFLYNGIL